MLEIPICQCENHQFLMHQYINYGFMISCFNIFSPLNAFICYSEMHVFSGWLVCFLSKYWHQQAGKTGWLQGRKHMSHQLKKLADAFSTLGLFFQDEKTSSHHLQSRTRTICFWIVQGLIRNLNSTKSHKKTTDVCKPRVTPTHIPFSVATCCFDLMCCQLPLTWELWYLIKA